MATSREYFDKDTSRALRCHATHTITHSATGESVEVIASLSLDFESGAKYVVLYIPASSITVHAVRYYLTHIETALVVNEGILTWSGFAGTDEHIASTDLRFSGRVNVYTPAQISVKEKLELTTVAEQHGLTVVIRDQEYTAIRASIERPLAFISHDSRDKEEFVRELAATLARMCCPVWYDEFTLVAGQSLRASIEMGLKECKKCVLVLSPHFLSNNGWTKAEFDSVFIREVHERVDVIVPVWLNVSEKEVFEYCPRLLDKVGIPASLGVEEVAKRIIRAVSP